jgi:indole-3-glycerol phosphate synthase
VNNRNLKTFVTDIDTSVQLAGLIPDRYVKGDREWLTRCRHMIRLHNAGYQAFLIGEAFMKTDDPATA